MSNNKNNLPTLKSVKQLQKIVEGANDRRIRQQQSRAPEITEDAILNLDPNPNPNLPRPYKNIRGMFAPKIRANIISQLIYAMDGRHTYPDEEIINTYDRILNSPIKHDDCPIIPSRDSCENYLYNTTLDQIIAFFVRKKRIYWKYQSYFNHLINYYKGNQDMYCEKAKNAVENLIWFIVDEEDKIQNNKTAVSQQIKKAVKQNLQNRKLTNQQRKAFQEIQLKHMQEALASLEKP